MKTHFYLIFLIIIIFIHSSVYSNHIMLCAFFGDYEAKVFHMSDNGEITYQYSISVPFDRRSIVFASNGKWGLIGGNTSSIYPEGKVTTILGVDENRDITCLGSVYNEYEYLVAISPDSRYGVYGANLGTLHFNNYNNTFTVINNTNSFITSYHASFSSLNNKLIVEDDVINRVVEYEISDTGNAVPTSNTLDISPAIAMGLPDNETSPDGKTCILINNCNMCITVLSIHKEGGFSLAQQFGKQSLNPRVVGFTPDSKYAIISFYGHVRSYEINYDSHLTEVSSIDLGTTAGEAMGVTPDGKYAVTGEAFNGYLIFHVFKIHEDGTLEYLPQNDYVCGGFVSAIAFVPPYKTAADPSWNMYH